MDGPARNLRSRKKTKKRSKKVITKLPHACSLCSYSTNDQNRMVLHIMRRHMGKKRFPCNLCSFQTTDHDEFKRHQGLHLDNEHYQCTECDFMTTQLSVFTNHFRMHTKDRPYGCDQCEYRTTDLNQLRDHLKTHTSEVLDTCYLCENKQSVQRAFKTNKNGRRLCHVHTCASFQLTSVHLCMLCQKGCIRRWRYRRTTVHVTTNSKLLYNYVNDVLTCSICTRTFKAKIGYYSHMQAHMRNKHREFVLLDHWNFCR